MKPTKQQLSNIKCHAEFLKNLPPPKENTFNMLYFGKLNDWEGATDPRVHWRPDSPHNLANQNQPECGFSACALGWAIHNPKLPKPTVVQEWSDYAEDIFGLLKFDDDLEVYVRSKWGVDSDGIVNNPFKYAFYSGWDKDEHAAADRLMDIYRHFNK